MQDLVDLKAQGKHNFFLLTELQVLSLVFKFQLFVSLVDSIEFFNEQLMRDSKQLTDGFFINVFRHE